jgi:hypothetical protein
MDETMAKDKPASKAVPKAPTKGSTKAKTPAPKAPTYSEAPVNPKVEANPFAQEPAPSWLEAIHEDLKLPEGLEHIPASTSELTYQNINNTAFEDRIKKENALVKAQKAVASILGEDQTVRPKFEPTTSSPNKSSAPFPRDGSKQTDVTDSDAKETGDNGSDARDDGTTHQTVATNIKNSTGDELLSVAGTASVYAETQEETPFTSHARFPGEGRAACWERIRKSLRAAGFPRGQGPGTAYEWATRETERLFPPPLPEPEPVEEEVAAVEPEPEMSTIVDIDSTSSAPPVPVQPAPAQSDSLVFVIPESWGELPDNASLQAEIAWVSANRLRVRAGSGVDLSKAKTPAPSYSALSWLETSILFPSKFADISVKATASQDDEKEHIRREKLAIEEIRSLLSEMLEG